MDNLEKIDLVRDRMKVSYQEAKNSLEASNWDVVNALVNLERNEQNKKNVFFIKGSELVQKAKIIIRKSNATKIRIKQDERVLIEIPVTAGVIGAVIAPEVAVIGAVAALVSQCKLEVERDFSPKDLN